MLRFGVHILSPFTQVGRTLEDRIEKYAFREHEMKRNLSCLLDYNIEISDWLEILHQGKNPEAKTLIKNKCFIRSAIRSPRTLTTAAKNRWATSHEKMIKRFDAMLFSTTKTSLKKVPYQTNRSCGLLRQLGEKMSFRKLFRQIVNKFNRTVRRPCSSVGGYET